MNEIQIAKQSLKKMLMGSDTQLLTAKDYRVASQLRIHAGKMLMGATPLIALGAFCNLPILMIPAFYVPAALAIPPINFLLLRTVPTGKTSSLAKAKKWLFSPVIGGVSLILLFIMYKSGLFGSQTNWFFGASPNSGYYAQHHGMAGHELRFQAKHYWDLVMFGLGMTGLCAGITWTLLKGRRTQSMQRIAQHLAIQEAENA